MMSYLEKCVRVFVGISLINDINICLNFRDMILESNTCYAFIVCVQASARSNHQCVNYKSNDMHTTLRYAQHGRKMHNTLHIYIAILVSHTQYSSGY